MLPFRASLICLCSSSYTSLSLISHLWLEFYILSGSNNTSPPDNTGECSDLLTHVYFIKGIYPLLSAMPSRVKDKQKSSDSVTAITNEVVVQNFFGSPKNPSKREQRYVNRHDTTQAPTSTSSTNHDELPSSSPTSALPWRGKVLKLLITSSKKKCKTPVKQKAKKAKKRVVKQKLGYKKLGCKASKAKPIAKGAKDSDGGDDDFCPVSDKSNNAKKRGGGKGAGKNSKSPASSNKIAVHPSPAKATAQLKPNKAVESDGVSDGSAS